MTRESFRRVAAATACALVSAGVLGPVAGCQSGGLGGILGSKSAMDMLSPMVKDAANSYLGNLASLTSSLGNLKDLQGVLDFVQKAQPMVEQLSSSYQTLSGTTGEERSNLMTAFGSKFKSANSDFLSQSSAAKSNGMWAQALSPVLDRIKLFQ